jgi:4-carboxymuconolactone decarboxylase
MNASRLKGRSATPRAPKPSPARRAAARAVRAGAAARPKRGADPWPAFAAAMARHDPRAARRTLARARRAGHPRRGAEETALMLVLHAGYPAALEAVRVLAEAWPGRAHATREGTPRAWRRRGVALCRRVYGPVYARLVAQVRARHPDLATWMVEEGYGRVLSRPGLAALERERVAVAVLAALGWERQLLSHLIGARRLGAGPAGIRRALAAGLAGAGAATRASARRAWRAFADSAATTSVATGRGRGASKARPFDRPQTLT